jgi:hypothetical protein
MSETAKKIYRYNNRITATLKPAVIKKVKAQAETTGESESQIVAAALDLYLNNNPMRRVSKHSY